MITEEVDFRLNRLALMVGERYDGLIMMMRWIYLSIDVSVLYPDSWTVEGRNLELLAHPFGYLHTLRDQFPLASIECIKIEQRFEGPPNRIPKLSPQIDGPEKLQI